MVQLRFVIYNFKAHINRHSDQEIERDRVFLNPFRIPDAIAVRLRLHPTVIITNAFVLSESKSSKQQNKSKNTKHITILEKNQQRIVFNLYKTLYKIQRNYKHPDKKQ